MKKMMILGGSRYILPVIEAIHQLGYSAITCDYIPGNIAHRYSDGYENISIVDKEAVLKSAERLNIDGIMSFACDPGVVVAAYVAEKMQLPTVGPYKSVCILQNKRKFRKFLKEHGFMVPLARGYRSKKAALEDMEHYNYPIIVKPSDSAGSKGVRKVNLPDELESSLENAFHASLSKEVIIEDFLECKGYPSDSECFTVDGDLKFVSFSAQRFDIESSNPFTPAGFTWQSTISKQNQMKLTNELQRLLNLLDMKTSIYNVETRECLDGKAYLMEVSPRGGGNRLAEMLKYTTGVDLIMCAVKAALGEKVMDISPCKINGYWSEVILHGNSQGRFSQLQISKEIEQYIVESDLWVHKGEQIDAFSGANKSIGTLVMRFDSEKMMNLVMNNPGEFIKIAVE